MDFYKTKMGQTFFERQLPQLIDAINTLAAALSEPVQPAVLPATADPQFLHDLFFGKYEPEIYKVSPELRPLNRTVNQTRHSLAETLPQESRQKLEEYESALSERNITVTEQAYRAGIHAAVQMILAGTSCPGAKRSAETEDTYEH